MKAMGNLALDLTGGEVDSMTYGKSRISRGSDRKSSPVEGDESPPSLTPQKKGVKREVSGTSFAEHAPASRADKRLQVKEIITTCLRDCLRTTGRKQDEVFAAVGEELGLALAASRGQKLPKASEPDRNLSVYEASAFCRATGSIELLEWQARELDLAVGTPPQVRAGQLLTELVGVLMGAGTR